MIFSLEEIAAELNANLPQGEIVRDSGAVHFYWNYLRNTPNFVEETAVSLTLTPTKILFAGISFPQHDSEDFHIYSSKEISTLEEWKEVRKGLDWWMEYSTPVPRTSNPSS